MFEKLLKAGANSAVKYNDKIQSNRDKLNDSSDDALIRIYKRASTLERLSEKNMAIAIILKERGYEFISGEWIR